MIYFVVFVVFVGWNCGFVEVLGFKGCYSFENVGWWGDGIVIFNLWFLGIKFWMRNIVFDFLKVDVYNLKDGFRFGIYVSNIFLRDCIFVILMKFMLGRIIFFY